MLDSRHWDSTPDQLSAGEIVGRPTAAEIAAQRIGRAYRLRVGRTKSA
jgi:hypothetical protein